MQIKKGYVAFSAVILKDWINNGVNYIKLSPIEIKNAPFEVFELVPNSEIPDTGETIHNVHSEEISDLLESMDKVKFLVHEIYLEEED